MTYVLGDIHGRGDRFREMLDILQFGENDSLYILGDVVDRNPDGVALLQEIRRRDNMHLLLGNHEHMMRNALDDPERFIGEGVTNRILWYYNGGAVTEEAFRALPAPEQEELLGYLWALPLDFSVRCGGEDYLLVHASPAEQYREDDWEYADATSYAVWNRFDPYTDTFDPERILICGHTPTVYFSFTRPMEVFRRGNVICMDCGCAYPSREGGRLACLCLESGEVYYTTGESV